MAEAAVEERPSALRFYCHLCNVQFANASAVSRFCLFVGLLLIDLIVEFHVSPLFERFYRGIGGEFGESDWFVRRIGFGR